MRQAYQIAEWDRQIAENGSKLLQLHQSIQHVNSQQEELEHKLQLIESKQVNLGGLLTTLETSVGKLDLNNGSVNQADIEREEGYKLAEKVNSQLDQMQKTLAQLIVKINNQQAPEEQDSPVFKIIDILNQHLSSLQWIDQTTQELNTKIGDVERLYTSSQGDR